MSNYRQYLITTLIIFAICTKFTLADDYTYAYGTTETLIPEKDQYGVLGIDAIRQTQVA